MKMNKIDLNNLDKSTWSTFRFDQIASSISERIDPNDTDLKYYIGLEHLDSENIHITRMGSPDDVNGQKLRCYPGDVIFGRRRAYQRKAAVCEVEGFCSAHSLVLRANPEIIDPKLFPFFLHSDAFMHRAVDISVGSLSPTINWGTLKKQEFLLPPKDQQAQLAELLWAMDEVVERGIALLKKILTLKARLLKDIFTKQWSHTDPCLGGFKTSDFPMKKLAAVCSESMFGPRFSSDLYCDDGNIACLRTTDFDAEGSINLATMPKAEIPGGKFKEHYLQSGDLVISRSGTCGLTAVFEGYKLPVLPAAFLIRFRITEKANPHYLKMFLNSHVGRSATSKLASGAVQKNLTSRALLDLKFPIPDKYIQVQVIELIEKLSIDKVKSKIKNSRFLQKSLNNQVF